MLSGDPIIYRKERQNGTNSILFEAENWLLYTKNEKRRKRWKKDLPKPLEYGTICERQALR